MKKILIIIILLAICIDAVAQSHRLDSLLAKIEQTDDRDQLTHLLREISRTQGGNLAILKQEKAALADAAAGGNIKKEEHALNLICYVDFQLYDAPALLENSLKGIRLSSGANDKYYLSRFKHKAALAYEFIGDSRKSAGYSLQAASTALEAKDTAEAFTNFSNLESDYAHLEKADSALYYAKVDLKLVAALKKPDKRSLYRMAYSDLGEAFKTANQMDSALAYQRRAYNAGKMIGLQDDQSLPYLLNDLAKTFLQMGRPDSALKYAQESYNIASKTRLWNFTYDASAILEKVYEGKDDKKALFYLKAEMAAKDSISANDASRRFQLINDKEQQRLRDLKDQRDKFNALVRFYTVIAAAAVLLVIGIILWRNNRKQRRSNVLLSEQKEEIEAQRDALEEKNEELGIESALERIRTVAMGMIKPDDLLSICETMFYQLEKLGFNDLRNAMINIHYNEKNYLLNYEFREGVGKTVVKVIYNSHPIVNNLVNHAQQPGEGFTEQVYTGETLEEWKAFRKGNGEADDPRLDNISGLYYYFYSIGTGSVGVSMFSVANAWQLEVLKRFRNVFDLAYKRYVDITNAEAQAHEAQIELGLERVRARAMAMQQSEELSELVALLVAELSKLDMALSWCLVTLLDEPSWSARVWRANSQQDQAPQSYYIPFADHLFQQAIMHAWKERQEKWSYVLTGEEKKTIDDYMFTKTDYSKLQQQVQAGIRAADPAYFYFSFGNFGGLQVGGPKQLSEESLDILARFGKVFDLTYTRFNDLKVAEMNARRAAEDLLKLQVEKKRTEDALIELRAAQKQLVQSEKMASLGELTAGIAHEIQNPLNFVNNFSEVNIELIEEMETELENGTTEEVIEILEDIKQNLQKISHHGKRADGIVKGMLQHSRASSNTKEPTDINKLADEYFRLAYHGLRAKDKTFNAELIVNFTDSLPAINIVPQDVGRVLLNLFTNAFYAVHQKQKTGAPAYQPTVTLSTAQEGKNLVIRVRDNGAGIPENIKDKIMQPFFTTKPTGEGTGLGLSMSHEIVRAHGGSIEVESAEGEYSEFIVQLPV